MGIVAHRDREVDAYALAQATGGSICFDDGRGCTRNHHHTWMQSADRGCDWAVVLEDDAIPVEGFREQLELVLAASPTPIVSLYLGRLRPLGAWQGRIQNALREANNVGAHWIVSNHCLHAVGVAIRTDLIGQMLDDTEHSGLDADDAITVWAQRRGHDISYSWPSLVDHRDGPTITQHWDGKPRKPGRVAWATGTRKRWNSRSVEMRGARLQRR